MQTQVLEWIDSVLQQSQLSCLLGTLHMVPTHTTYASLQALLPSKIKQQMLFAVCIFSNRILLPSFLCNSMGKMNLDRLLWHQVIVCWSGDLFQIPLLDISLRW